MSLKQRWLRCLPAGLLLAALVLAVVWLMRPGAFLRFAPLDDATDIHLYTMDAGVGHAFREARPSQEELQPLLEALSGAEVKLAGRSRNIQWRQEDTLYSLFAGHEEDGAWVMDADLDICTDGYIYVYKGWLGNLRYRLTDRHVAGVNAALAELVGMEAASGE